MRRATKNGVKFHFYAWRGGPKFWTSDNRYPTAPQFFAALAQATARSQPNTYMTAQMVDDFLSSAEIP